MKTYKEFIAEARQRGDLHHYTSLSGLRGILNDNAIKATTKTISSEGYTSFTRNGNLHNDYTQPFSKSNLRGNSPHDRFGVKTMTSIVLDGNRLSDKYKISPFLYTTNRGEDRTFRDGKMKTYSKKHNYPESEERIKGSVTNIKPLIKKIRLHSPINPKHLKELESHGIPIEHTYKNEII